MEAPNCPDCNVPMDPGHVQDRTDTSPRPAYWQAGLLPPARKLLGIPDTEHSTGPREMRMIVSYCCPDCGLLREYTLKKPTA